MMAEEFGYQVSPRPASEMTPTVGAVVNAELDRAKSEQNQIPPVLAIPCALVAIFAALLTNDAPLIGRLLLPAIGIAMWTSSVRDENKIKANKQAAERRAAVALSSPWQAWPCRLEELPGGQGKGMMLLAPDKAVACTFSSPVPESIWVGTPDGRGVFWFAGDLRFGGLMSAPGGSPLWWAHPVPTPQTVAPTGRRQEALEGAVIDEAVGFAFDEWL
ncbi:hypothetical protein [Streptomyces sp. NBC_01237]|nr:hypothetical protein [Streptomyces sp. NBC_01237]WRZ70171.1 hypothetical protein OG251_00070 [Streptomyces sp. NBC_01237]